MTHKPHYENKLLLSLRSKLSLSVYEASSVSDSEADMSVVEVLVALEADFVARFLYGFLLC